MIPFTDVWCPRERSNVDCSCRKSHFGRIPLIDLQFSLYLVLTLFTSNIRHRQKVLPLHHRRKKGFDFLVLGCHASLQPTAHAAFSAAGTEGDLLGLSNCNRASIYGKGVLPSLARRPCVPQATAKNKPTSHLSTCSSRVIVSCKSPVVSVNRSEPIRLSAHGVSVCIADETT